MNLPHENKTCCDYIGQLLLSGLLVVFWVGNMQKHHFI